MQTRRQAQGRLPLPRLDDVLSIFAEDLPAPSYLLPRTRINHVPLSVNLPFNYASAFEQLQNGIVHDACEWITKHTAIERWIMADDLDTLYLTGQCGSGKTSLIVYLKGYLEGLLSPLSKPALVLYNFCSAQENSTVNTMLCNALHQMIRSTPLLYDIVQEVARTYDGVTIQNLPTMPIKVIWELFCSILEESNLKTVYLLIDGLDECSQHTQTTFLTLLNSKSERLKVLITAQSLSHLADLSSAEAKLEARSVELNLNNERSATSRSLELFIDYRIEQLRASTRHSQHDLARISTALKSTHHVTLLHAHIYLKTLKRSSTGTTIELLPSMSKVSTLSSIYDHLFDIVFQAPSDRVLLILKHILYAYRPLSISELYTACGYGDFEQHNVVINALDPVLDIRPYDKSVVLVHHSLKDYLLSESCPGSLSSCQATPHLDLAISCLNILIVASGERFPHTTEDWYASKTQVLYMKYPLLEYALHNWVTHVREAQQRALPALAMSKLRGLLNTLWNVIDQKSEIQGDGFKETMHREWSNFPCDRLVTQLDFMTYLGFVGLGIEQASSSTASACQLQKLVWIAANSANSALLKSLVELPDIGGLNHPAWATLINCATGSRDADVIRFVMTQRTFGPKEMAIAAYNAASSDDWSLVDVLFEDLHTLSRKAGVARMNVLHWIAAMSLNCRSSEVSLLLISYLVNKGLSINEPDSMGNTILHHACLNNAPANLKFIRGLFEAGANPGIRNRFGQLPLHLAARRLHFKAFEFLLSKTHVLGFVRRSERSMGSSRHHENFSPWASNGKLTPLHWAMRRSCVMLEEDFLVVQKLLLEGFDLADATISGRTAASEAIESPEISRVLCLVYFRLDGASTRFSLETSKTMGMVAEAKTVDKIWWTLEFEPRFQFLPGFKNLGELGRTSVALLRSIFLLYMIPRQLLVRSALLKPPPTSLGDEISRSAKGRVTEPSEALVQYRIWNFLKHWVDHEGLQDDMDRSKKLCEAPFQALRYNYLLRLQALRNSDKTERSTRSQHRTSIKNMVSLEELVELDRLDMVEGWPQFALNMCIQSRDLWNTSDLLRVITFIYRHVHFRNRTSLSGTRWIKESINGTADGYNEEPSASIDGYTEDKRALLARQKLRQLANKENMAGSGKNETLVQKALLRLLKRSVDLAL